MAEPAELELPGGQRVPVTRTLTIGRGEGADVVLGDSEASRRHAEVSLDDGRLLLTDLESRNGTSVNGERLTAPRSLRDGDVIRIGQTQIVVRDPRLVDATVIGAPPPDDAFATIIAPSPVSIPPAAAASASSPLQVLGRITRTITGMQDALEIANAVTSAIREEFGCDGASLVLREDVSGTLYFASVASDTPGLKLLTLNPGEGIVGRAIQSGEAALVPDVSREPAHAVSIDRSQGFTSRSIIVAPVAGAGGATIGALEAVNPSGKTAFDADDLEFLSLVAVALAGALDKATNWRRLEQDRTALARVAAIRQRFIAISPAMLRLVMEAASLYEARTPICLAGEPGTGRRTLARLVHETAGVPDGLIEVEGASALRQGDSAAVLITGLDALTAAEQEDLAKFLEQASGRRPLFVIANATEGAIPPALQAHLAAGLLRLPPLRSLPEELALMVERFSAENSDRLGRAAFTFSDECLAHLREHGWPGNVRELREIVTRAGILSRGAVIEWRNLQEFAPELAGPPSATIVRETPLSRRRNALRAQAEADAHNGDGEARRAAAQALAADRSPAAAALLLQLLNDEDAPVRSAAAEALASRDGAAGELAGRLENEVDVAVARTLIRALASTGEAAEQPVVFRALGAGDALMRLYALQALHGTPLAHEAADAVREDPDPSVRARALAELIRAGEPLEDQLAALTEDPAGAAAACEELGELGLATNRLIQLTANGERAVRAAAIRALGHSNSTDANPVLMELLSDATVSADAAAALGEARATEAIPRLRALLSAPEAPLATRETVVRALANLGGPEATEAIEQAAGSPELAGVVVQAAEMMNSAIPQAAARARAEQLTRAGSASPAAALAALESLLRLTEAAGDVEVIAAAAGALDTPATRALALDLLEELQNPSAIPLLLPHADQADARAVIDSFGGAALPALLQALQGPTAPAAVELLAGMGANAAPALCGLLDDAALGRTAVRALVEIGDAALPAIISATEGAGPQALPGLLQVLGRVAPGHVANYVATFLAHDEPAVHYASLVALGDLPDARSERELLLRVDSADPAEAALATLALGRIQSDEAFGTFAERLAPRDRRAQYALAGAVNEYNLRQGPVVEMVRRMVREGLPFSFAALQAAVHAGALADKDILAAIGATSVPETQKLRLIGAIGRLEYQEAVPLLLPVLRGLPPEPLLGAAAAALARHEAAAREEIAELVLAPNFAPAGLRVLSLMQDSRTIMWVLRKLAPGLATNESLRAALRNMGDLVLGPLIDVINENWELESLSLLWQLTEVAAPETP